MTSDTEMTLRNAGAERTATRRLIVLGLLSLLGYVAIAILTRQFALSVPSVERPHLLMLGLLAGVFAGYLIALREAVRITDQRRVLRVVAGFAIAFRAVLLGTTPVQEIDLYRYVWDGNVVASGVSPYRYSPRRVTEAAATAAVSSGESSLPTSTSEPFPDDLQRLVELTQNSPALARMLQTIHYPQLTSPYPPVSQAVFALAAVTTPDHAAVHTHLCVLKAWIVLCDLLTIVVILGLLRATGRPFGWCLAYAWCPLVLKEFANSGHLDAIAVLLTTTALWLLVSPGSAHHDDQSSRPAVRSLIASLLLGLGVGAKLYPAVLLPLTATWLWKREGWRHAAVFAGVCLIAAGASLLPMFAAGPADDPARHAAETPDSPPLSPGATGPAESPLSGLAAFLTRWEMNDLLFKIVVENTDPSRPQSRRPWFVIVPQQVQWAIVSPVMQLYGVPAHRAAFLLARGVTLCVFTATLWWLCRRIHLAGAFDDSQASEAMLLEAGFLALAWFWLLAPTQNPWYWIWGLPLIPFARNRAWLWVSGAVLIYYLRFWLRAHWPEPPGPFGSGCDGASFFDFVIVWGEFGPVFAALLIGWLLRGRQQ